MEPIVELSPVGKYLTGLQVGPKIDIIKAIITDLSDQGSIVATSQNSLRKSTTGYLTIVLEKALKDLVDNKCLIAVAVAGVNLGYVVSYEALKNLQHVRQLYLERLPLYLKEISSDSDFEKIFEKRLIIAIAKNSVLSKEISAKKLAAKYSVIKEPEWQQIIDDQIVKGTLIKTDDLVSLNLEKLTQILPSDLIAKITAPPTTNLPELILPKLNIAQLITDVIVHIPTIPTQIAYTKKAMLAEIQRVTKEQLQIEITDTIAEKILVAAVQKNIIYKTNMHMINHKYWITQSNKA